MTNIKLEHFLKKGNQFGDKFLTEECFEKESRKHQIKEFIHEGKPLRNLNKRVQSGDSSLSFLHLLDN